VVYVVKKQHIFSKTTLNMKNFCILALTLVYCATASSQANGNFKQRAASPSLNESNYNNVNRLQEQQAQAAYGATIAGDNMVEYNIRVLANLRADAYTAIFNVVQIGKTAEECNTSLNNRINPFIADMKAAGIKMEDIFVDMVNFLPKFEYDVSKKLFSKKTYTEIPIGFELQKNVHVRFTDPTVLDRIVEAAARYEIYDIVKVDYFVKDVKQVNNQLRAAALEHYREIRAAYKDILNLDSAYIVTGENVRVSYPGDRYQSYQAFSSQVLDPSQRADSKVERVDKPISQFYNAIPANEYDIVINPEILEPCVQFSYHLVVRCTLKERILATKTKKEKEFLLVTPNGEVKTLKIE
jgi:Protein of unknown function (DUF541)